MEPEEEEGDAAKNVTPRWVTPAGLSLRYPPQPSFSSGLQLREWVFFFFSIFLFSVPLLAVGGIREKW